MDTLLIVAIIMIALSIAVQAGALLAMYLLSRQVAQNVDHLAAETRKLIDPLERVAANLKSASDDLADIGHTAREEAHRIDHTVKETTDTLRAEIQELRSRINHTVTEVQEAISAPVREWSAIRSGIAVGVRTFLGASETSATAGDEPRQHPAA